MGIDTGAARYRIEELCVQNDVYKYNEKLKERYKLIKWINELVDMYSSGEVYILHPETVSGVTLRKALYGRNQKKIVCNCANDDPSKRLRILIRTGKATRHVRLIIDTTKREETASRQSVRNAILRIVNRCKVINIYNFFRDKGCLLKEEWYYKAGIMYSDIYADHEDYQKAQGQEERVTAVKRLIGDYLSVRDFVSAGNWIKKLEELQGGQDEEVKRYGKMWEEIQSCLEEIKESIGQREHIVVNWVDALRVDELHNMEFLRKKVENGICFKNMYTATPYTSATMRTLLTGKHLIDDRAYAMSGGDYANSRLLQCLRQHGYKFICSSPVFQQGVFDNEDTFSMHAYYQRREQVPSTLMQFDAVCRLAEEKQNCFLMIHNLCETHYPYLNPVNGKKEIVNINFASKTEVHEAMKQIVMSQQYLDMQLAYYSRFYADVRYNIYMSDHGQGRGEKPFCTEGLSHIVFSIGGDLRKRDIDSVTSLIAFPDIVEKCLQGRTEEVESVWSKGYAWIQLDDVYAKTRLESLKENKLENSLQHLQYRSVMTDRDGYLRFAMGEEYYISGGSCEEISDDKRSDERIAYLRELAGNLFIDIRRVEKYKAAIELYDCLGYKLSDEIQFVE